MPRVTDFYKQCNKWIFCQTKVKFAGFQVSYRIDASITEALVNFSTPTNCTNLRSFFGLVNQLSSQHRHCGPAPAAMLPPLLSTKHEFVWLAEHESGIH